MIGGPAGAACRRHPEQKAGDVLHQQGGRRQHQGGADVVGEHLDHRSALPEGLRTAQAHHLVEKFARFVAVVVGANNTLGA